MAKQDTNPILRDSRLEPIGFDIKMAADSKSVNPQNVKSKSNLHYTRGITCDEWRGSSLLVVGLFLWRGFVSFSRIASGQHNSEETCETIASRWRQCV